ncbi:MAG: branched-chain-amino-acid transaminase [Phycisphaerales bacterium JB043]
MPATSTRQVWIDGDLKPSEEASVSVFDHCLLYGDGVFEGIRAYNGRVFKLRSHLKRLMRSADSIRLKVPYSIDELAGIIRETLDANEIMDGYIRLVVTRGVGTLGLHPFKCPTPTVICITDTIELYPPEMYEEGMPIIVAERPRIPVECLDPRIKSCNYMNNILAKIEAIDAGVLEALMLNTDGQVGECTGDNVFIVSEQCVFTPPPEVGVLEGVTRSFVMDLCTQMDIPCKEEVLSLEDVLDADEVFLTGTAAEMIAVTQIDETTIGDGKEGPVTKRLRERFREIVSQDAPED